MIGATPAALNSSTWSVTVTQSGPNTGPGFRAIAVSNDDSGGVGLWLVEGSSFGLYPLAGGGTEFPFTASISQPVTATINPSAQTITIAGATTGNGTFDISSAAPGPWFIAGRDLYIGCYGDISSFVLDGTISDIT